MNNREYQEILENLLHRIDLLEKQLKKSKKADKDYDGDGEVESGTEEYFGSKDKAIKKSIAKKKNKKIQEALDRVGGNYNNNNPGLRCLMHMVNKNSPLVESASNILSNKKQTTTNKFKDNGTKIQLSESLTFGGFPALRKLNENGVVGQFNDSDDRGNDEKVATRTDSVAQKIGLMNSWGGNPVEYDVTTDEGLARALQHIQGVRTGMDAADSRSNISQSELDADKHNSQFLDQLTQMAKQRRLKVKHQGIGGHWTMDYGASK
jgi:hypothetical protein